jgi:hypothetical protein
LARKYNRKLTADERASLFGDELIALTAAYVANPNAETLADYNAALIGRCASMAAQAALPTREQLEGIKIELAELWLQMDELRAARAHDGGA